MKVITTAQYEAIVDSIMAESKRKSELIHHSFTGLNSQELHDEVSKRLGSSDWAVKPGQALKLLWDDIDAVASNRYYQRIGRNVLLAIIIIILGLSDLAAYNLLPFKVFYIIATACALVGVIFYGAGRRKARKGLRDAIKSGEGIEPLEKE